MPKTEPEVSLRARAKRAADDVSRKDIVWLVWAPLGLLFFGFAIITYPLVALVAFLACVGLFIILTLRHVFKPDKPIDDTAGIAATRLPIIRDAEQETSWDERARGVLAYVCGEAIGWVVVGTIWCLFLLVRSYSTYAGMAAISCGMLILALTAWRALKADTKAFDDPNENSRTKRLINDSCERARR